MLLNIKWYSPITQHEASLSVSQLLKSWRYAEVITHLELINTWFSDFVMAIIPGLPGIEIHICVAGKKLAEIHNPEDLEDKSGNDYRGSKLIESATPGQEFVICLKVKKDFQLQDERLGLNIIVDGTRSSYPSIHKASLAKGDCTYQVAKMEYNREPKNLAFRDTSIGELTL